MKRHAVPSHLRPLVITHQPTHPSFPPRLTGQVYWDVFKTAKLDDLRPRAPAPEEGVAGGAAAGGPGAPQRGSAPAGKAARVQHSSHSASKMPAGFMSVSENEGRMLNYLADFEHIFSELYPHR